MYTWWLVDPRSFCGNLAGVVHAGSTEVGAELGIHVQRLHLESWGRAGEAGREVRGESGSVQPQPILVEL